jgi:hypothetical protein
VVGIFRPKPHARSIIKPKPSSLGLFFWNLKTFLSPDPIHSILTNLESINIQKPCHLTITISSKKFGKINHPFSKLLFKWISFIFISLSASIKANNFTGPTFGNVEHFNDMVNGFFLTGRA